jgi:PmbA protein
VQTGISFNKKKIISVLKKIKEKNYNSFKNINLNTGTYPVIFTPKSLSSILPSLVMALNGRSVEKKISPLFNSEAKKILPSSFTLVDSGILDGALNSSPFDDEGIKSKENLLIEKGVLKNFILDLYTASKLKKKPTSNGRRSFSSLPSPSPNTLIVKEGKTSLSSILKKEKRLILIDQLIGWAGNPLSGEFSGNCELAFLVENGKIKGRVKNIVVSGNIYNHFQKITAISKEKEFFGSSYYLPYIAVKNIPIAGEG